jgi:hypothetical protein
LECKSRIERLLKSTQRRNSAISSKEERPCTKKPNTLRIEISNPGWLGINEFNLIALAISPVNAIPATLSSRSMLDLMTKDMITSNVRVRF